MSDILEVIIENPEDAQHSIEILKQIRQLWREHNILPSNRDKFITDDDVVYEYNYTIFTSQGIILKFW